ncbi:MAG: hypothetical protein JO199_06935 [Candidatus Eremiobacteraeota bacterium]|nr:hypothetical protein [Candidatus Eremiobacteraeota bacterium]
MSARRTAIAVPIVVASAFAAFLCASGVPALRHDWSAWIGADYFSNAWSSFGGWRTDGFGSPRPFPTDYLLVAANAAIALICGNAIGYDVDAFLIGLATACGGALLTRRFTQSIVATIAGAAFATFNPWVYNQVVAGHIYMVLTYAAAMLLISEMLREHPSPFRLGAFLLLTMGQLQFFLPSFLAVVVWTLRARTNERPVRAGAWALVVTVVAALPLAIGFVAERGFLKSVPYTLTWQTSGSVEPLAAVTLNGYFARYAESLGWLGASAMWIVAGLALAGAIVAVVRRPNVAVWPLAGAVAVWIVVGGTKGILGSAYTWLVVHVPESGLYRELYDAVAFLAIAYVVGCAALAQRFARIAWLWGACGVALLVAWAFLPPAHFWVSAQSLPKTDVNAPRNTRYALMPPLQPIVYRTGSGLDPDAVVLPDNVTPLNTPQFSDPESPALVHYAITGDPFWLQSLSVSEVIERPQYRTDVDSLRYQLALPPAALPKRPAGATQLDPLPELLLADIPDLSDVPQPLWRNAIFFGDARGVEGPGVPSSWHDAAPVAVVAPSSPAVGAQNGWVDARSAFVVLPGLFQTLGGTITTNPQALLRVDPSKWMLVSINGSLANAAGDVLATSTKGYRWLPPSGTDAVRCLGRCVVVAQTERVVPAPASLATARGACTAAPDFHLVAPWLLTSALPASPDCLLRYNVRFDPHWNAYAGTVGLAHVAIDSAANGWIVPSHDSDERLVIVETAAAAQFVAQVAAIAFLLAFGIAGYFGWRP